MDKQPHTFEEYMTQARLRPRLVLENEIEEMLAGVEHTRVEGKRSQWARSIGLSAIAFLVGAATYLMAPWKEAALTTPRNISRDSRYQVFVLRDSLTGDSTVVTIPVASAVESPQWIPAKSATIPGVHLLELTADELSRIGARRDTDGVWVYYRDDHGKMQGLGTTVRGTIFSTRPTSDDAQGLRLLDNLPVLITDDLGNHRMMSYDDEKVDSVLARRMKALPAGSRERLRLETELSRKADSYTIGRMNMLIPIIVRTGRAYTRNDSLAKKWRPDAILWYEPTPEVLTALPEHVRKELAGELDAVKKEPSEAPLASVQQQPHQAPRMKSRLQSQSQSEPRKPAEPDKPVDSISVPRQVSEPADNAVTGRSYFEQSRSETILDATLFPNPARERTTVRYQLSQPHTVTISLYDITGRELRELAHVESGSTNELQVDLPLDGIRSGIYLIAITTDSGERVVQRLVVDK